MSTIRAWAAEAAYRLAIWAPDWAEDPFWALWWHLEKRRLAPELVKPGLND